MNIDDLITSGRLELYVAGTLSQREMGEVALYAMEYPEVAVELERIERAMVDFLSVEAIHMEDREKERQIDLILNLIHHQDVLEFRPRKVVRLSRFAVAAIFAGLLLTTLTAAFLGIRFRDLNADLSAWRARQADLVRQTALSFAGFDQVRSEFDMMRSALTRRAELAPVPGNRITGAGDYALVYWNPESKKVLLAGANLPALAPGEQYQLWALYHNKPVDAGVFDAPARGQALQAGPVFQKDIVAAQGFAVTVEPKGGSKAPSMDHLCMTAKL